MRCADNTCGRDPGTDPGLRSGRPRPESQKSARKTSTASDFVAGVEVVGPPDFPDFAVDSEVILPHNAPHFNSYLDLSIVESCTWQYLQPPGADPGLRSGKPGLVKRKSVLGGLDFEVFFFSSGAHAPLSTSCCWKLHLHCIVWKGSWGQGWSRPKPSLIDCSLQLTVQWVVDFSSQFPL